MAAHNTLCPIYEAQSRAGQARNQERLLASVDAMARQMREINRGQIQPEAPSPAPVPVVVAESLSSENDNRNLWNENNELKQRIIELEKKVELLMEWSNRVAVGQSRWPPPGHGE